MEAIRFPAVVVDKAIASLPESKDKEDLSLLRRRSALRRLVDLPATALTKKQVTALFKACGDSNGKFKEEITFLYNAKRDPSKIKVKNLREVVTAFKGFMADNFIKGFLFQRSEYGALTAYLPVNITYTAPSKHNSEYVTLSMVYTDVSGQERNRQRVLYDSTLLSAFKQMNREEAEKLAAKLQQEEDDAADDEDEDDDTDTRQSRFLRRRAAMNLGEGIPMDRILAELGYYKETKDLHEVYEKQFERLVKYITMYGKQFKVRGEASGTHGFWGYSSRSSMLVDGRPSRAIMDTRPLTDLEEESTGKKRRRRTEDDDSEEASSDIDLATLTRHDFVLRKVGADVPFYPPSLGADFEVPTHLELKIFHLEKHEFYNLHVVNMTPYKYKEDIKQNLILPEDVVELAELLAGTEDEEAEDVIEGKSQGTLVACIGDPGLGKTLLAEVISEQVKKPLYKIQASQLGLDPETLERELKVLLHRAERWDAVLMIDEANAYIHDRGVDVKQNAIVGVFLRLLEYYRGILFLTTNQTGPDGNNIDIDDAILSRCSAVVTFELPTVENARRLWKLQGKLLKIPVDNELAKEAADRFNFSGRTIRQLLRLAGRLARKRETQVTMETLESTRKFIALTRQEGLRKSKV